MAQERTNPRKLRKFLGRGKNYLTGHWNDQIVPYQAASLKQAKLVTGAVLKVYKGAPHGMCTTRKDDVNADLFAFIEGKALVDISKAA